MLLVLTIALIASLVILNKNKLYGVKYSDTTIQEYYGEKLPYVLNSDIYTIAGLDIMITDFYDVEKANLKEIKGNDSETIVFDEIMDAIGKVNYNETQNDPNKISDYGGNCQAYSLLLEAYCKQNNITSKLHYTDKHMYNHVQLMGVWYKVDVTKGIMEIL